MRSHGRFWALRNWGLEKSSYSCVEVAAWKGQVSWQSHQLGDYSNCPNEKLGWEQRHIWSRNGGKERREESERCEGHPEVRAGSGLGFLLLSLKLLEGSKSVHASYPRGRPSRFTSASMAMLLRCIFLWPSWWQSQVLPEPAELQTWGWLILCKENVSKPVLLMESMCWVHTCGSVYVPCYTFDFSYFISPRHLLLCAAGSRMRWAPYLSVFHYIYVDIVLASVYLDSSKQNT